MNLVSFRIKNFRSIIDTGWCSLSSDGITCLVGQNEAGKTAILEALNSFYSEEILPEDKRSETDEPIVYCNFKTTKKKITQFAGKYNLPKNFVKTLKDLDYVISVSCTWSDDRAIYSIEQNELINLFNIENVNDSTDELNSESMEGISSENIFVEGETPGNQLVGHEIKSVDSRIEINTEEDFIESIWHYIPEFEYFKDFESLLPNRIDISQISSSDKSIEGLKGVKNFLSLTDLKIENFKDGDERIVENQIDRVNSNITDDYVRFWSQTIGRRTKIGIKCELKHHSLPSVNAGAAYLVFWIRDGREKLYPKQRSKGVRWFLSFYLQLKAKSNSDSDKKTLFLIDEPGGSLHSKAQKDVIKLLENIKDKSQVIYTTHSPYLVELDKLFRILAVQRTDIEDDRSETKVFGAHSLCSAEKETLSPIYSAMGVDLSHQQLIKARNNIILEEISAHYYLKSFLLLTKEKFAVQFIAAQGVTNVPMLVNLFLGWGIDFRVVLDGDNSAKKIYNKIKKAVFLDNDSKCKENMLRIRDCKGIEDLFSKRDFKKYILKDKSVKYSGDNSVYLKKKGASKGLLAADFMTRVKDDLIKFDDFEDSTKKKIGGLISSIKNLLS